MKQAVTAIAVIVPIALLTLAVLNIASVDRRTETQRDLDYMCADDLALDDAQHEDPRALAPIGNIRAGQQFRVLCPQVDAGTVAHLLTPTDGGTAGKFVKADSVYVAPVTGSSAKVRVGYGTALTPSLGMEIGTSSRDGPGVSIDEVETSDPTCVSVGNAQAVDVVVGVQ